LGSANHDTLQIDVLVRKGVTELKRDVEIYNAIDYRQRSDSQQEADESRKLLLSHISAVDPEIQEPRLNNEKKSETGLNSDLNTRKPISKRKRECHGEE
jgi:hypothetical protein